MEGVEAAPKGGVGPKAYPLGLGGRFRLGLRWISRAEQVLLPSLRIAQSGVVLLVSCLVHDW